jgi:hypothetical protein
MRRRIVVGGTLGAVISAIVLTSTPSARQQPPILPLAGVALSEFTGVYAWEPNAFVYLQMWDEFAGFGKPRQLVAFDESGDVRVLYPTDRDGFFTGPTAAVATSIQSKIRFQRNANGTIVSLTWQREGGPARTAERVEIERREAVQFSDGDVHLAGTLTSPAAGARHPAMILVHGSGPENRDYILPWAYEGDRRTEDGWGRRRGHPLTPTAPAAANRGGARHASHANCSETLGRPATADTTRPCPNR